MRSRVVIPALVTALAAVTVMIHPARSARALQVLRDGVFAVGSEHATSRPGTVEVRGTRGSVWITPGALLQPTEVRVFARTNANDTYSLDVRYGRPAGGSGSASCERALLSLAGATFLSGSWGGDDTACSVDFELDPARALAAAALFHTTRQDRHPIGMHVTASFTTPRRTYAPGDPIEIVLTLTNPGGPVVRWRRGGSNRGPRDNQFSFAITRDGLPVSLLEGMDFGGISQLLVLAPGASAEVRTPLMPWADLTPRGHYVVDCAYETVFVPDGVDPYAATSMGEIWARSFTARVPFDVR